MKIGKEKAKLEQVSVFRRNAGVRIENSASFLSLDQIASREKAEKVHKSYVSYFFIPKNAKNRHLLDRHY